MKILVVNRESLFYDYFKDRGIGLAIYRDLNGLLSKLLRRIHVKLGLPYLSFWFTKQFKQVDFNKEDAIVIFDSMLSVAPANYLKARYRNIRIIFWHWNHIDDPRIFVPLNKEIERWTYDPYDLRAYKLLFNTQFYIKDLCVLDKIVERDCFFIGAVKSRGQYIKECERMIDKAHLSKLFILGGDSRNDREKKWVPYDEILKYIQTSKCIVDIIPDTQYGMTLRPLEALFHRKKLITNYKDIKKMDLYHPDNIFVMGDDNPDSLQSFLNTPFNNEVLPSIDHYDVSEWLRRFGLDN